MANPQPDKYTALSNELYEQIIRLPLTGYQSRVLHAVIRKTYGFKKKNDRISLSQLSELTGIAKPHVSRALRELSQIKIITKDGNKVGINKNYESWLKITKDGNELKKEKLPPMVIGITTDGNKSLPPAAPQKKKETITKENSGAASPENKKRENGFESVGSLVGNNPLRTRFQSEAIRFAENLNINLEDADKRLPSIRSRFFKLFKVAEVNRREGLLSTAYSYCFDNPTFQSLSPDKKILFFMWKFNNPNKEVSL